VSQNLTADYAAIVHQISKRIWRNSPRIKELLTLRDERRKGRSKVNNIRTTTLLVIAICTAVLSADAEAATAYVHKVEDPADFLVGGPVYSGPPTRNSEASPLLLQEETP
jgi:hypothetical protein